MSQFYDQASLVMVPSGYKAGKVYSQKPLSTDGELTFTRNSNATRVNADGLVEKVRTNLLLQSNQFDTTWSLASATITGGQSGYDSTLNAWAFTTSIAGATIQQNITSSGVLNVSIYAKAGTVNGIRLRLDAATDADGFFNLSTGTVFSITGSAIDANIMSMGGGWYRCDLAANISTPVKFAIYTTDGTGSYDNGTIYIQNAQLETGDIATDYIPTTSAAVSVGATTNTPRLNYSNGCPSLLLEPQRTNLIPYSENFDNWVKQNGVSVTQNTSETLSPQGYYNADKITGNGTAGVIVSSLGLAATNTKSVYLKGVSGGETVKLKDPNQTLNTLTCNLTTEWQRFELTETQSGLYGMWIDDIPSGGIYAWGAQLEAGSYATSYIPTLGASVTRLADAASKTGITSLIGQTEGTLFIEVDTAVLGAVFGVFTRRFLTISDGTTSNRIIVLQNFSDDSIGLLVSVGGISQASIVSAANQSGIKKIAVGYANNDFVMYINGVQIGTDTSGSVPACSRLGVGSYETSDNISNAACPVSQTLLFKTRLTNAQLAELTTL